MARSIHGGRGQEPIPMTERGSIAGAGEGGGSEAGRETGRIAAPFRGPGVGGAGTGLRSRSEPLQTRKLRCRPLRVQETRSFPVRRHQAGSSSSTEDSVERISRRPPGPSASMWRRMRRRRPPPQSRSPPSSLESERRGWRSTGSTAPPSVRDAGAPVREELDELRAPHDRGAPDEFPLVELALLEAGGTDEELPPRLREVVHQLPEGREALLVDL